ncbi:MAG: hypothetical protein EXS46_03985 [Candidatus Taylorbacteria bacterium]|nr:hypothetical protein [Candidatus Taylorbacteria bacterium]
MMDGKEIVASTNRKSATADGIGPNPKMSVRRRGGKLGGTTTCHVGRPPKQEREVIRVLAWAIFIIKLF